MNITDLISPERVTQRSDVASKKKALELLGNLIADAEPAITSRAIFDSLLGRERLGSTGLGHGVALPHGRLAGSDHAIGAVLKLEQGIDFDAMDQQPVDIMFALLVPEHFTDEHLKIIAYLAEMFDDKLFCEQLRAVTSDQQLYEKLTSWQPAAGL
ncbi:MAG: PTS IIA-like nitrogen regulatory protein PtsN [Candidatus Competibacteraceae bacterium]|nr:PTS IIA-like nitrogen regulatory protein PtsN [Candidatus Competibacteraceae bacterium]MCB1808020.1 PTS IIA-like nitrogen regulatory protein PtsN [Candidatus Competibacteraceae bacterium]MCB1811028.1 PTS IIA-like nitrogen regulatory protein PtsN [Candidatus Competibacteraceae bacterium]